MLIMYEQEYQIILPKVSVIIPCYNQSVYVGDAIESALGQTYPNVEIICIDDCSTDNSSNIIRSYAEKYKNISFIQLDKNKGVCLARNTAINSCNGEYILPLDADDIIDKTYVEKAVEIMEENPEVGIVYCDARIFGVKNKKWKLPEFNKNNIIFQNCIFNSAMFRKKDFISCGGYKENMNCGCEDWDFWLSMVEKDVKVYKIEEDLFFYRKIKKESRTDLTQNSQNEILKNLFNNHINLYINNEEFYNRVFSVQKNRQKYRRLFNLFLGISTIELLTILLLMAKIF